MAGENRVQITISANAADAKAALADVRRQLDDLGGGARDAGRNMDGLGSSLGSVRGLLAGLGVAMAAREMAQFGAAVFETGKQMESLNLSFKAITGSAAGAQRELANIRQLAQGYGQDFLSMAQATKTFLAASKDTELVGAGAREVIRGVSAAVAALGLSSQDAQGVFLALGQMMSKGTVQAEELRGQLGERLPGAFGLAAKAMGVSTAELGKMLEQGQVLATDLVPKLARALEQEYGPAAVEAANTWQGQVNRMSTSWDNFLLAVAGTSTFRNLVTAVTEMADGVLKQLTRMISGTKTVESYARNYKEIQRLEQERDFLSQSLSKGEKYARRTGRGGIRTEDSLRTVENRLDELYSTKGFSQQELKTYLTNLENWIYEVEQRDGKRQGGRPSADMIKLPEVRTMLETLRPRAFARGEEDYAAHQNSVLAGIKKQIADDTARETASQKAILESRTHSSNPAIAATARFELARDKVWKDVYSGKITHDAFEEIMRGLEDNLKAALKKANNPNAANAAAKADIRGSGVLQRVEDEISAVEESLGGNRLGAAIAKIEREHNKALTQIRADLVGAKGGVEELHAAEKELGKLRDLKIKQAQVKAYYQELDFWANNLSRVGELKNDPIMAHAGKLTKLEADLGREIEDITGTAASKAQASWDTAMEASMNSGADTTAIWRGVAADWANIDQERIEKTRLVEERAQLERKDSYYKSLGDAATLDQGYFDHKRKLLDNEMLALRGVVTSETALRTYAGRKYSELARQELEARMDGQDSFLGYLGDYLSREFGLYKDHATRTREMWNDMAASSVQFLRSLGQELQTGLSDYLDALLTNDSAKRERAWRDMLNRMLSDAMRWIVDLGMMWAKQTLFIPVVASVVGVDSSGLEGLGLNVAGGQGKGGGGLSLSKIGQYGGYAKDGYNAFGGGSSIINSIDKWGFNTLGIGSASSYTSAAIPMTAAQEAMAVEMGGTAGLSATHTGAAASVSGGLGSMLSAGAMGAGAGFMGGQLMRPDDPTSSYVGGAAGLAGGATAAYLGAGAWAGPVGIAAGLIASAITALATPETKSYSWGVPKASQPAVWVVDGEDVAASYGVIKTTSSGMFGSSSTKHTAIYDLASSEISAEVKAGMDAAGANLKALAKSLGQTEADFKSTMKGVQSLMIAIPEGMEQVVYQNLTNQKAEHYLKAMGLLDQANALLRSGESYIDLINRTETAAATAGAALGVMGLNLEQMAGSAERLIQGDWASRVIETMGGADAFTGAMSRFNKWAYTGAEQAAHATEYFGGKAVEAIGEIQASGVTLTDFWGQYRARMEAGMMTPEEFGQWANAATWVEQAYNSAASAAEQQIQVEQQRLAAMQATRQELEQQAGAWGKAGDSLRDFLHSMRVDQYTTLSPTANLAERQKAYNDALALAKTGDLGAQDDFRQYAQDFREFAYDFHGANQDYVAIDKMIQDDTAGLISAADMQLAATNEQIARLDAQILASQQLLASSSLVNDNLARVAGAVEASGSSIVGAINSLGANASFNGGGQAAAIADANSGYQQLLASFGASADTATPDLSAIWWAPQYAHGGPVTGGIPGVDSVPAILMPGERVLSVEHNQLIERLATSGNVDTSTLERLVAQLISAVAGGNAAVAKLLARVEDNTATVASHVERQ